MVLFFLAIITCCVSVLLLLPFSRRVYFVALVFLVFLLATCNALVLRFFATLFLSLLLFFLSVLMALFFVSVSLLYFSLR